MLLQTKWKSKCCFPRGISQDCQRRFGKWRNGHWKSEKIIKGIFSTVLKQDLYRRLKSTSPSNSRDQRDQKTKSMRCPFKDVEGLQQAQEDKEILINLLKNAHITNRTDILAYASKHQDYDLVVKPKHKHRQTVNFLRIKGYNCLVTKVVILHFCLKFILQSFLWNGNLLPGPIYYLTCCNSYCYSLGDARAVFIQTFNKSNFTSHLRLFAQVHTDIDASRHQVKNHTLET